MGKKQPLLLFLILILVLLLRFPSLFEPYWYGDEGIYFAVAETLKRGGVLYKDATDNKTPLIYYLFTLSKTQFWVRLVACLWVLLNTVFIYFLGRKLLGKRKATLATLIFGLFVSLPLLEGNIANGELFLILPTTIGFFLLTRSFSSIIHCPLSIIHLLLSGFFFALAFLFKAPALTDFGAAIIFLFLTHPLPRNFLKKVSFLTLGFLITILPFFAYFYLVGCFPQFLAASFLNNFPYTAAWGGGIFSSQTLLFFKLLLLLFSTLLLFAFRKGVEFSTLLIYPWLFFAFFGATLSSRPYPHYLIQVVPSFSLVLGKLFSQKKRISDLLLTFLAVFFALKLFNLSFLNLQYQIAYFRNFKDFASGRKPDREYLAFFDPNTFRDYKIANFLRKTTKDSDKIFIWGDQALIYALSQRSAAGRFVSAHHINDIQGAREETIIALKREKPKYIFVVNPVKFDFADLFKILNEEYNKTGEIANIDIYFKIEEIHPAQRGG